MALNDYFDSVQKGKITPKDPFSHAAWLLLKEESPLQADLDKGDIVDKQVILSYIGDDKLLRFYQTDVVILTELRNMAARDPVLYPVYNTIFSAWAGELKMTRTKKGLERQLQGTTGGSYAPRDSFGAGFGEELAAEAKKNEAKQFDAGSTVSNLFAKFGKKR